MAGLNFSTTTIINSLDNAKVVYSRKWNAEDKVWENDTTGSKKLRLGRGVDLEADNITAVYKTVGHGPTMCKATVALGGLVGDYRLDVTLGTDGASPLIFAKPDVQNGIPFWVGIHADTAIDAAFVTELVKTINKNKLFTIGDNLLTVEASGTNLVLTGNSEFLRFRKVELMKFEDATENSQEKTVKVDGKVDIVKGYNGFGTYSHIIKDLRLPTGANLAFNHLRQDETPAPGTIYTQYVIEYEAPSSIRGTQVVGSVNHSHTQHVAWVAASEVSNFDALLKAAKLPGDTASTTDVNEAVTSVEDSHLDD